jgi:hypothetical protein
MRVAPTAKPARPSWDLLTGEASPARETGQETQATEGAASPSAGPRGENGEPREKRSRDRYGRERTPRGERGEREERPDLRIPAQSGTAETGQTDPSAPASQQAGAEPIRTESERAAPVAPAVDANASRMQPRSVPTCFRPMSCRKWQKGPDCNG